KLLQQGLEEQAFVDVLDHRGPVPCKSPPCARRPMEARAAPVPQRVRARDDGGELVAPANETTDALQGIRRQLLFGGELDFECDLLEGTAATALDDRARRIDPGTAALDHAQRARSLESTFAGQLRLDAIAGRGSAEEDD